MAELTGIAARISTSGARSRSRRPGAGWGMASAAVALLAAAPLGALLTLAAQPTAGVWSHLAANVLPRAAQTTALLLLGVGLATAVVGVGVAWLSAMCRFPGVRFFEWALLLPLAIPTYIAAYAYVELLDSLGPVQGMLRAVFGWRSPADYAFPQVRSLGGAVFVLSAVLYPYVYLSARASFLLQSAAALEVSRALGCGPWSAFLRVALPLARPAIAAGVALALMECLNDIGAVQHLGVTTLTLSVYTTWLHRGSLVGAAQIASLMLLLVAALLAVERFARRRHRHHGGAHRHRPASPQVLRGWRAAAAFTACALPLAAGFLAPAAMLLSDASRRWRAALDPAFLDAVRHSVVLAVTAAAVTLLGALVIVYGQRLSRGPLAPFAARIASAGYAVPGTVLAIGVLVPLAALDNAVDAWARDLFGISTGLLLTGSTAALVYAYAVRYMAVAYGALDAGLTRISPHLDMAARTLGRTAGGVLRQIHAPLLRPALATAGLLVFVDGMKELPATILLRPFDFDTLSTMVYEAASREAFADGAPAALAIVVAGLVPVIVLARTARTPVRFGADRALRRGSGSGKP